MTSPVDIANQALSLAETRSKVASFDEGSPEANEIVLWYDSTRRQVLRMAYWGCARAYANLALLKALPGTPENPSAATGPWTPVWPPSPWLYSYAYPVDCLASRYIISVPTANLGGVPIFSTPTSTAALPFSGPPVQAMVMSDKDMQGNRIKAICTNQSQATLCYTADILDPNLWDEGLSNAISFALAAQIVGQLTGARDKKLDLWKLANKSIIDARVQDANESGPATVDSTPDWIRVRGYEAIYGGGYSMLEPYAPLFPTTI